jgi:hypothetical protein
MFAGFSCGLKALIKEYIVIRLVQRGLTPQ